MTLLIAAKSGYRLKPNGTNFIFEPGIVIAADSRLSYSDGTYVDDGLKVDKTGPYGICGMSSDSIDIPTKAFHFFDAFMGENPTISSVKAAKRLQAFLKNAHTNSTSRNEVKRIKTSAFFGHMDPSTNRFSLYILDSENQFLPQERECLNAAGSHANWVFESFYRIRYEYPTCKLHPFDGFPDNKVPVRDGLAVLIIALVNAALNVAVVDEIITNCRQGIGGNAQAMILTATGPVAFRPQLHNMLRAWQIYSNFLG